MRLPTLILSALAGVAAVPAQASAAPADPFGNACAPKGAALFCPADDLSKRVPSWDGVPLDVDVTLPGSGDGPFPTVVLLHGYGLTKTSLEATDAGAVFGYNDLNLAQRGYAVVTYTARGFGNSCGSPSSRTVGCENGWLHSGDERYEAHDAQYLLGLLVDEGIASPQALGAVGISFGGGNALLLAYLRNRVRLPDDTFVPWASPNGVPLTMTAAWSRWGWSDLRYALAPNGRFRDEPNPNIDASGAIEGVEKQSYFDLGNSYANAAGFLPAPGQDTSADINLLKRYFDAGEPMPWGRGSLIDTQLWKHRSASALGTTTVPLLIQQGWTDHIFPAEQALRVYRQLARVQGADVRLQLGDLGHPRGANAPAVNQRFIADGLAFLDAHLRHTGTLPRRVVVFEQRCPKGADPGKPFEASKWDDIAQGQFAFGGSRPQLVTSRGGNKATALALDPAKSGDACTTVKREHARGTAVYEVTSGGFTLLGLPLIEARVKTKGKYGQLAARLWDVSHGHQLLVDRGVFRLKRNQRGKIRFQLNGNAYRFPKGHGIKLELLGRDPGSYRPSNGRFSVRVRDLVVSLPERTKP